MFDVYLKKWIFFFIFNFIIIIFASTKNFNFPFPWIGTLNLPKEPLQESSQAKLKQKEFAAPERTSSLPNMVPRRKPKVPPPVKPRKTRSQSLLESMQGIPSEIDTQAATVEKSSSALLSEKSLESKPSLSEWSSELAAPPGAQLSSCDPLAKNECGTSSKETTLLSQEAIERPNPANGKTDHVKKPSRCVVS